MATVQITDTQQAKLAIAEVDKKGNPVDPGAPGFGTPVWNTSDPTIATVVPSVDGASAAVVAAGKLGTCQVSVAVGTGADALSGTIDVQVVAGPAATIAITAATPTEQ